MSGHRPTCLVTWGSSAGPVREAAQRLKASGEPVRVVALRLIAPVQQEALAAALGGASHILVIKKNQAAQLFHYLLGERALPPHALSFARPGPLPMRPGEIVAAVISRH